MKARLLAASVFVALVCTSTAAAHRNATLIARVPSSVIEGALCVHSGWHFTSHRVHGQRPEYMLGGRGFWRTWNVPDYIRGGTGEASWHYRGMFRGGLQWTYGTWQRAGGSGDPASASPGEEIYRLWRIVRRNGGRWSDWPNTARACGLPT